MIDSSKVYIEIISNIEVEAYSVKYPRKGPVMAIRHHVLATFTKLKSIESARVIRIKISKIDLYTIR